MVSGWLPLVFWKITVRNKSKLFPLIGFSVYVVREKASFPLTPVHTVLGFRVFRVELAVGFYYCPTKIIKTRTCGFLPP